MKRFIGMALTSLLPVLGFGQTTLQTVDFETTSGYTVSGGQTTTPDDWWERATSAQVNPTNPFSGYQGSYFFYAEDTDNGRANDEPAYCTLNSTNVSSYTNLQIKILVAGKNDPGSAYEREEYLRIQYAFDGGAFTTRAQFIAANVDDAYMSEDANADGVADGPALSPAFAEFTYSIPAAGSNLQIRIMGSSDQAGEEFGFDNIRVSGTLAPTEAPPTVSSVAAASVAATSATLGGDVTADGGAAVSDRGVVVSLSSTNTDPRIGGTGVTQVSIGSGTGVYSQSVGSLSRGASYHFNAYAINSVGTNYGSVRSFTTLIPGMGLTGNGNAIASGAAAQAANGTKFRPLLPGDSWTNTFSISNNGTETLTISGFEHINPDFEIAGLPATVAVGGASNFTVKFAPTSVGTYNDWLTISNDSPTAAYLVRLYGPCYSVSTNAGPFGGGNEITIANGYFGDITNVLVNGVAATLVESSGSLFTIVLPAATDAGPADIVAQTSDEGDVLLAGAYTYNPAGWIIDSEILADWSRWGEVAGMPSALRSMDAAVLNGKIHVGGGQAAGILTNFCAYDGTNWQNLAQFPAVRRNVAFAVLNGTLYSIGGQSAAGAYANVYAFNGTSWSSSVSLPAARSRLGAATLDGKIYAVGGSSSTTLGTGMQTNVYAFDGTNWTEVAGLPMALEGMAVETLNGALYSMGGTTNGVTNVFRFDGTEWTEVAGMPEPRTYMGSAAMDGKIYAVGGLYMWARTNVYAFDGTNWTETAPLPAARRNLAAAELDGHLYAIGGDSIFTSLTNVFVYPGTETVTGVMPSSGACTGGASVVITGTNFGNGTDITNVTLCGVAATITNQTDRRVWVLAAAGTAGVGDVVVQSASCGTTVKSNAFEYLRGAQAALTFAPASPRTYGTTNALSVAGGSGTGAVSYAVTGGPGTIAGGTNLAVTAGSGTITVVATKAQDDRYFARSATATVSCVKADQSIADFLPTNGSAFATTAAPGLSATASSGLGVTFAVGSGPGTISGGTNLSFTGAGAVRVVASQAGDDNWNPAADETNVYTVGKGTAQVYLQDLAQTYDGTARTITATTMPAGLTVEFTYDGDAAAPTNAGTYAVTGTVNDANYEGFAADSLGVGKASATVFPGGLAQTYDGTARTVTATTMPAGLTVEFTYDGSATAPTNAGTYAVTGTVNEVNYQGFAAGSLTVGKAAAMVYLGDLAQTYDGMARTASATTMPAGLTVEFTYDGGAAAPTNAGSYAVTGTVDEANWQGSAADTLVVGKASATVYLGGLSQTYDGTARTVTATTMPAGLTVEFTYGGGAAAPTNAGSYAVTGTVNEVNYRGSAADTLAVGKAAAQVYLQDLVQPYDGTARTATATTMPAGLVVEFTYDGHAWAPTNVGSYAVTGTVNEVNYRGSAADTLTVGKAAATVYLGDLAQTYDGTARTVTATTMPAGLTVECTYDGGATAPTNAGTYAVTGTVNDASYAGSAADTLVVGKAAATVYLGDLEQTYDGTARTVTATTMPAGLTVEFTYDGGVSAPTNAGSYAVTGAVNDVNYRGSAAGTLTVARALDAIAFGDTNQIYDGTARVVTATAGSGSPVALTYAGNAWAPTNAGVYAVTGVVAAANWEATNTATLTVGKADQTIENFLPADGEMFDLRESAAISATASSGGAVDFANLTPALATLVGTDITFIRPGLAQVEATQAGDANWNLVARVHGWRVMNSQNALCDFDGDGKADLAVYHAAAGNWYIKESSTGNRRVVQWGWSSALPVPGDYDGDGLTDVAVYHPSSGNWFMACSAAGNRTAQWGWGSAVPVPGDYDGDGTTDIAVYDPIRLNWHLRMSAAGDQTVAWGLSNSVPATADYDGDGVADLATYRPATGTWSIRYRHFAKYRPSEQTVQWGWSEAVPVPGDYDGDGAADIAVFHRATGNWYLLCSTAGIRIEAWGWAGTTPVAADYDGDGAADVSVYHQPAGNWYELESGSGLSSGAIPFGWSAARPVLLSPLIHSWFGLP